MLEILSSLSEYFNLWNKGTPKAAQKELQKEKVLYIIFDGNKPGIYMSYEDIIKEKFEARWKKEDLTWKKI